MTFQELLVTPFGYDDTPPQNVSVFAFNSDQASIGKKNVLCRYCRTALAEGVSERQVSNVVFKSPICNK